MHAPIYLDNNATTRPDPRVVDAMLPFLGEMYGNASSQGHAFGWQAEEAVEQARGHVARLVGAEPREIVWTSGATEADNLALKGVLMQQPGAHLVTVATEHPAILETACALQSAGHAVTFLGVGTDGLLDLQELEAALTERTALVSVMLANNEIGTLQPLAEIGHLCRARGVLFHSDAAQGADKIAVDVQAQNIDLLSLSAHKMHGPQGVGALYVRRRNPRVHLLPQMHGGGQERGVRSGTLNVPGIVGFGKAAALALAEREADAAHVTGLRDRLWRALQNGIPDVRLNGHPTQRLPNNLNVTFPGVESDALLANLPGLALSSGSACASGAAHGSPVLAALGVSDADARATLRFGLSRFTTEDEIDRAADALTQAVRRLRTLSTEGAAV